MTKKSEMIGFKTTPEIRTRLERIAKEEDRSLSYVINRILEKELAAKPIIVESIKQQKTDKQNNIYGEVIEISLGKK